MSAARPEYRLGRIIGAYLRTRKGNRELHPAVIITPDAEIVQPKQFDPRAGGENVLAVMGVSTKYKLYPDRHIRLPYEPSGRGLTQLTKDCAAIIGWYDIISIPDDVVFRAGDVPSRLMVALNDAIRQDIRQRIGREFRELSDIMPLLFPDRA